MKDRENRTMFIDIRHFYEFENSFELKDAITSEYYRFEPYLNRALENLMKTKFNEWATNKNFYVSFYGTESQEK